jgi:Tfp pilus assembly protein PilF
MSLLLAIVLATNFPIGSSDRATASPQTHHWKHYVTAKNFYDKQKYVEAAHELQHATAQERNTASYFLLLAKTYEKLGKYQQASDSYYRTGEIYKKNRL